MNLNPKDLRTIELFNKYGQQNLSENLIEYNLMINTLAYLNEAISEERVQIKHWQKPSETLLYKFFLHGLTLHNILSGLQFNSLYYEEMLNTKIIDFSSAKVVLRSQMEAFLMYHYIYVNPKDEDLKEIRYNAWIYSALLQRQAFSTESEFGKQQKALDLVEIEKMKFTIINLKAFKDLSINQQKSLIEKGSGKLFSHWSTILKETGFNENGLFYEIYNHLSMYSHSEGISIIQMSLQPGGHENTLNQANLDLNHSKLLVCLMITSVLNLFKVAKDRFEKLPENLRWDIELYTQLARMM